VDLENVVAKSLPTTSGPMNVGSTTALPLSEAPDPSESIMLHTADGEVIEVAEQVQLYAPNALLKHPLVSPALSYLGGLPPLLFIAGDKEVLRDEIIYACVFFALCFQLIDVSFRAHRAAHPERFPARDEVKEMYPVLKNVEKHMRPTPVHLQVYDGISVLCSASRS
jgi:acetyl esterase/lipase